MIVGRESAHDADQHAHWVGIGAITEQKTAHPLVDHGVASDQRVEVLPLGRIGQLAVQQEITHL